MRCKAFADEAFQTGHEVLFVCRPQSGDLVDHLKGEGIEVASLPISRYETAPFEPQSEAVQLEDAGQTLDAIGSKGADWIVVDHYGLSAPWEQALRCRVQRIAVIDDLANRRHDCDILLDQNYYGVKSAIRYTDLIASSTTLLLGPTCALMPQVFSQLKRSLPERDGFINRILVYFGAVDSKNQTSTVLRSLMDLKTTHPIRVDVVVGYANKYIDEITRLASELRFATIRRPLSNLAGLMARADIMLGAGGAVTWERCALGLPAVVVYASENQRGFTLLLHNQGAHICLGPATGVTSNDWAIAIDQLLRDSSRLGNMSRAANGMTDGMGAQRLLGAVTKCPRKLNLRVATLSDESLLFHWVNEIGVRRQSFQTSEIPLKQHQDWFRKKINDPSCAILVAEDQRGLPIGQVRFEYKNGRATIDISIDKALRGQGFGVQILNRAIKLLREQGRTAKFVAEVKSENLTSVEMFRQAGFIAAAPINSVSAVITMELS